MIKKGNIRYIQHNYKITDNLQISEKKLITQETKLYGTLSSRPVIPNVWVAAPPPTNFLT